MYFRERVELVSRSWRRRETALKKDSWIVGSAGEADEVVVVLFLSELVTFCDLVGTGAAGAEDDVKVSLVVEELVKFEAMEAVDGCAVIVAFSNLIEISD